jgi:hypothetical protein
MTDMTAIERLKASQKFGKALLKEKRKQTKLADKRDAVDWRGQHGAIVDEMTDDERPEPVKRVQPPIERMWKRGILDDAQYIAAKRLHNAYALGVCGARDPEAKSSGEAALSFGLAGAALVAIREYREAQDAVGRRLWPFLDWVVNKDIPLSDLSKQLDRNPTELTALLKIALDILSDHHSDVDHRTKREAKRP